MKNTLIPEKITLPELEVDRDKCSGCSRCIKSCPTRVLILDNDKKCAFSKRYSLFLCLNCHNCIAVCSKNAIKIHGSYRVHKGLWKNDHIFEQNPTYHPASEKNISQIEQVIYERRSIRLYDNRQVSEESINRILEAGRFAPSAGNNQPWKFIVIQDKNIIKQINEKCKRSLKLHSKVLMPQNWLKRKNNKPSFSWWQKIIIPVLAKMYPGETDLRVRAGVNAATSDPDYDIFFNAPTVIIQLADRRAIGGIDYDSGICAQNMVLTAHALGLGTCYIGLIDALKLHKKFTKEVLGVKDPFEIVMALTLGYPEGKIDSPVKRERLRVEWIK